jgi:hypothetical protein
MADFYLRPATGFSLAQWLDPARPAGTLSPSDPGEPSRVNARLQAPHTRWRCTVGAGCTVEAILDGESEPRDDIADLVGRLFSSWWVEWPAPLVTLTHDVRTNIISFTPAAAGHYLLAVHRPSGGIVLCHFDAEAP